MVVGLLSLDIFLPYSNSLKDKRKVLNSLRDKIRKRYNVALAELDFQDKWQRTRIGIVSLNREKRVVDGILQKIATEIRDSVDGEVVGTDIRFF